MSKKVKVKSLNQLDWEDFLEESPEAVSGQTLTREFNQMYGTSLHYNDLNAYLHRTFGIAGTDGSESNYHTFGVKWKENRPNVIEIGGDQ